MFIFTFVLVTTIYILPSVQCFEQSKYHLSEYVNNKDVNTELDSLIDNQKPVDLAMGTPDFVPPSFMRHALLNASSSLDASFHQYTDPSGFQELREEIVRLYSTLINRQLNVNENVVVTMGAMQALHLTMSAYTSPGDEWIILEPVFKNYFDTIKMTGGTIRPVTLKTNVAQGKSSSRDFIFNKDELRKAFNSKTKGIIVNNPHNPTGKVFTKEELLFIAELALKWDTLIISDEVYEWITLDSNKHIRMASLGKDIFNRTITLSSISKTFFATGWRVGWAYGPSELIKNLKARQPSTILSVNSYAQIAATEGIRKIRHELGSTHSYVNNLVKFLEYQRDFMSKVLGEIGMEVIVPQTGFYIYANWTNLEPKIPSLEKENGDSRDIKFANWLVKNGGVLVTPGTTMYDIQTKNMGEHYVRLCIAKKRETLKRAATLLLKQFPK